MTITSYTLAGTASSETRAGEGGNPEWINPNNAKVDDSNFAFGNPNKNDYGSWLRVTNFSFSIPGGSTINGIQVQINRDHDGGAEAVDSAVFLRKTSGQVGSNFASATSWPLDNPTTETYGDATELWGTTWSVAEINSSDFGLDLSVLGDGNNASSNVYFIKIRIHYTAGAGGQTRKIKIAGTFQDKPIKTKVAGTFVDKPIKIKVGGTFQDA